jgi:aryl-alcohol dehydrogenase-like predicted oxidoreductase
VEQRRVGRSGLTVSRLALGTMTWGGDTTEGDAADQLRAFLGAGGNLVDTADRYVDGESERILGRMLRPGGLVDRSEVVLATKAGSGGAARGQLLSSLDGSLHRLGIDHVDLWQLHAWDRRTPVEETLSALDAAVASGRARYVGISNFCGWQTAKAVTWQAGWPGRAPIVSTQVEYSLLARSIEREVLPAVQDAGLGLFAWSPLGRGVLTGKYRDGSPADSRHAVPRWRGFIEPYLTDQASRVVEAVVTAADGLGVAPLAVALAWVRDRPGVAAPVVGARTLGQLLASLEAESLTLPAEIVAALDEVSAPAFGYPERVPWG